VAAEQLQMVLAHTRAGTLVATGFAVLMAWYAHGTLDTAWVAGWIALKLAVAALRVGVATVQRRRGDFGAAAQRLTYGLLAVDGAVWGVAGWRMMAEAEPVAALVAAAMACVGCVATFGLQARSLATAAYTLPMLVPSAFGLLWRGDRFGAVGGVGLLLLQGLLLLTANATQQRLAVGMLLRGRAEALAREKDAALQAARQQGEAKNQFVAKVSHELRTPLHGILGLTQLLRDDTAPGGPAARRLELVAASAEHLKTLIDDLLDLSRIDGGRFVLRARATELAALVREVGDLHAPRAQARGLTFECDVAMPAPCWVDADAARLRQVLHNLVGNAVKFTSHGGVALRAEYAPGAGTLRVTVRDSGRGIAADDLGRVFEAFQQGRDASAGPTEGVGLGLTIAREIARAMGGDVAASSDPGSGSTFVFTAQLPALEAPAAAQSAPRAQAARPDVHRVLVAEDDEVNALIVGTFLSELGLAVQRVADGRAAVAAALREGARPDAVLMDCTMPVMDGWDAARAIRDAEHQRGWPRVPIVALTATAGDADRRRCFDAGMDGVVTKPFTRDQLARAIGALAPPVS
jgi:signal transduction histidine kinase